VEISNDPAVAALAVAAVRDGRDEFDVAVGDIHTAESFPTASMKSSGEALTARIHATGARGLICP
jgi:hypothetical protein